MISFRQKGDFSKLNSFLEKSKEVIKLSTLDKYGREGVRILENATPKDTGKTSKSWYYEIIRTKDSVTITFNNSNIQNEVPIAIILQYGHATRNGGWVEGIDYINPSVKPLFERLAKDSWEEVKRV